MAIPEAQLRACLRATGEFIEKRRPPVHIRDKLDLRANIKGSEVVIAEVRPSFQNPQQSREHAVAKIKWVGTRKVWRLFWMRADLKWHAYEPHPQARDIATLFEEVNRDRHGCFFG